MRCLIVTLFFLAKFMFFIDRKQRRLFPRIRWLQRFCSVLETVEDAPRFERLFLKIYDKIIETTCEQTVAMSGIMAEEVCDWWDCTLCAAPLRLHVFFFKHVSGFKNRVSVLKPVNRVTLHPKPIILYQNKLNNNLYIIFTDYYEQQQNIYFIISVI